MVAGVVPLAMTAAPAGRTAQRQEFSRMINIRADKRVYGLINKAYRVCVCVCVFDLAKLLMTHFLKNLREVS